MDTLVQCKCGHSIAAHDSLDGCQGERMRPCGCRLDAERVLEAACRENRSEWAAAAEQAS